VVAGAAAARRLSSSGDSSRPAGTAWHGILMTWTMRSPGFQATVTRQALQVTSGAPAQEQQLLELAPLCSQASGSSSRNTGATTSQGSQQARGNHSS
jgi:hypothetical protein